MSDPLCTLDPAHGRGTYGSQIGPLCGDCWHTRTARGVEPQATRDVDGPPISHRLNEGIDEDGDVPVGAHDDWYDTPQAHPDDHHQFPIVIAGLLMWQQGPAVHCSKAHGFGHAAENYARQCERARALRDMRDEELEKVTARSVAEALGVPLSKARRMVTARNKGARFGGELAAFIREARGL